MHFVFGNGPRPVFKHATTHVFLSFTFQWRTHLTTQGRCKRPPDIVSNRLYCLWTEIPRSNSESTQFSPNPEHCYSYPSPFQGGPSHITKQKVHGPFLAAKVQALKLRQVKLRLIKRNCNISICLNILKLLKFRVISIFLKLLKYWIIIQYIAIYWIVPESPNSIYPNIIQYWRLKLYFWNRTV